MTIGRAEVIVTSPDRNFVTLKLTTADGVIGLGNATLNGRELAVVAYLTEHVVPLLIGADESRIEDTWQIPFRRGPVTMAAIAAVDTALWDDKGKVAGLPEYQLLGGGGIAGYRNRRELGGLYSVTSPCGGEVTRKRRATSTHVSIAPSHRASTSRCVKSSQPRLRDDRPRGHGDRARPASSRVRAHRGRIDQGAGMQGLGLDTATVVRVLRTHLCEP